MILLHLPKKYWQSWKMYNDDSKRAAFIGLFFRYKKLVMIPPLKEVIMEITRVPIWSEIKIIGDKKYVYFLEVPVGEGEKLEEKPKEKAEGEKKRRRTQREMYPNNHRNWTEIDEYALKDLVLRIGPKWKKIGEKMGRKARACMQRWEKLHKRDQTLVHRLNPMAE